MRQFLMKSGVAAAVGLLLSPGAQALSFTIAGSSAVAQNLANGQTGNITPTGSLTVGGATVAVTLSNSSGTVTLNNQGTIGQTGTGRALRGTTLGGAYSVTNGSAANQLASIRSTDNDTFQVNVDNAVSMENYGIVQSLNSTGGGGQAIDWNAIKTKSNILHNFSQGLILARAADAVRPGVNGIVANDAGATIRAVPGATNSDGIDAQTNSGVQVTNGGTIEGRHGITGGDSSGSAYTMSVTNNAGGVITGVNGSGINIDGSGSVVTVNNSGSIVGNWDSVNYVDGDGDGVDVDGVVNLTNNGIIRGVGSTSVGGSEGVTVGGGTVVNNAGAEISGNNDPSASGSSGVSHGIYVADVNDSNAYAATNVTNGGLIRGYQSEAIKIVSTFDNSIVNNAGGTIRGAGAAAGAAIDLSAGGGNDTLVNRGAIVADNGRAVDLGAGNNALAIEGGAASVQGDISGGVGGSNTLNFNVGTGNAFSYSGALSNFAQVNVNSGTTTLSGSSVYSGPTAVNGGVLSVTNATGSATGSGAVDVKAGASFIGTGQIAGPLTLDSGATLSPGVGGIGAVGVGNLVLSPGSTFFVELDPINHLSDLAKVTGTVSLDLSNLVLTLLSAPTLGQFFDILDNDGTDLVGGLFSQGASVTGVFGGHDYYFRIDYASNNDGGALGNDIRLTAFDPFAPTVPEPGTGLLFGLGGMPMAFKRRLRPNLA